MKLGDAIATVATPIARTFNMDCIDPATNNLRPESSCAKVKNRLNNGENLFTVMYDRFFEKREQGEQMDFIIALKVSAERSSQIDQKKIEDSCGGEILSVNPRPAPQPRPANAPLPQAVPQARA